MIEIEYIEKSNSFKVTFESRHYNDQNSDCENVAESYWFSIQERIITLMTANLIKMVMTAKQIIQKLNLQPHPEGGYYRETYRSREVIPQDSLNSSFEGDRNVSTAIYFMLTSENFSAFHKVNQDEIWHFHQGSPIVLHIITPDGNHQKVYIGNHIESDENPQYCVPATCWFAAEVVNPNSFSLVSCTVAPGFDFKDFTLAKRVDLLSKFPAHEEIIMQFTRE